MLLYRGLSFLRGEEATSSRLFEVEPSGRITWECIVTARGKNIYAVYQATRYPKSFVQPLFDAYQGAGDTLMVRSLPYI
jgi:hypothetical protein